MALAVNRKIGNPTVTFSPGFYKTAYENYRNGIYKELIEMMNRAESDSFVAGCLTGRKSGFQTDWSITPYSDDNRDIDNAEWMQSVLSNLDTRTLFKDIQEARLKKFSVIDFEWDIADNQQVPVSHEKYEHKYFKYKDGVLFIDHGKSLIEIDEYALVCDTKEMPVLLPVLRDYILKDFGLNSWASFIETFGEAMVIGKYPPGSGTDIKDEMEAAVEALGSSARGTMPDTGNIEVVETSRNTGDHEKFVDASNKGISITTLGHANAVETSNGLQVGENLTQYKVRRDIAVDDMFFIESYFQRLIRKIYTRNKIDGRVPRGYLDKKEPVNVRERLDILDQYYNQGGIIDPDEYRKLGIKIDDNQEPLQKTSLNLFD